MGTVALAKAPDGYNHRGNRKVHTFDVTLTGSYVTGGETVTARSVGMWNIETVEGVIGDAASAVGALIPRWNTATNKLQFYTSNGASPASLQEKTVAAYNTATTGRLEFVGR